jgi:hypothetical protein
MTLPEITLTILGLCAGLAFGWMIGVVHRQGEIRDEAVRAGVAEYYIGTNFAKEFRWKTPP